MTDNPPAEVTLGNHCPDGAYYIAHVDGGAIQMYCRCLICARCGGHANPHQGHLIGVCRVTGAMRGPHLCCPDDCELEAAACSNPA